MADPIEHARAAAETAAKLSEIADKISKVIDKIYVLKKEGQGLSIKVPERTCQYDAAVRVQKHGLATKNILFPLPEVERITATCMPSFFYLTNAIVKVPEGFILHYNAIPEGTELVLLNFEYRIPNPAFITNLVERSVSVEPLQYDDRDEYWMNAQLKFPQALQKIYSHLSLQDIDLNVDVAVDNEVKTTIPNYVTRGLRAIRKLLSQSDRNLTHTAFIEYLRTRRQIGTDIYTLIAEINALFIPERFMKFVEVTEPFRYYNSRQGTEFHDFPGQVVPKTMRVTSRTDLNLETPAKEGKVIYKKKSLSEELAKVFS